MRKHIILSSALLLCSPFALADGYSDDPRVTADLNETTMEADADIDARADLDTTDTDIDVDANAELTIDGDLDADTELNADADIDVDTNIDDRFEQMAKRTMAEFREFNTNFNELADNAYGYAVFDTTKGGLFVTGTGGTGVAVNSMTGEKTYMRVGGAGLGIGGGLQQYKLVFLFETEDDFEEFTNGDWNGQAAAQAVAIQSGAAATASFEDGVAAFQMNQKGLMAQADLSGLKFWVADNLQTRGS